EGELHEEHRAARVGADVPGHPAAMALWHRGAHRPPARPAHAETGRGRLSYSPHWRTNTVPLRAMKPSRLPSAPRAPTVTSMASDTAPPNSFDFGDLKMKPPGPPLSTAWT